MDARVIGERSDAVLWTAKPGHDVERVAHATWKILWQVAVKPSAVIPGRRHERVNALMGAPRNDDREVFQQTASAGNGALAAKPRVNPPVARHLPCSAPCKPAWFRQAFTID